MFIVFIKSFLYLIDILKYSFVILFFISELIVLIMIVLRFFLEKVLIIVLINFLKYDIFV